MVKNNVEDVPTLVRLVDSIVIIVYLVPMGQPIDFNLIMLINLEIIMLIYILVVVKVDTLNIIKNVLNVNCLASLVPL